jgi:protein transport protein SEC13
MQNSLCTVETSHDDMIHDSQFDYYSTKLATCSSDRTIKIFDVKDDTYHNCATLRGHEGPVWQVAWAHPKFGVLLASCSYDGSVIVYRESPQNQWSPVYEHKFHESSVNSISWAPHEYGLILACASSDGRISTIEHKVDTWIVKDFQNDTLGCNSVSWAPYGAYDPHESLAAVSSTTQGDDGNNQVVPTMRLVTGSCDNTVRFWRYSLANGQWLEETKVDNKSPHNDWVRDVAWAPTSGLPSNIIASCSEDRSVHIWSDSGDDGTWKSTLLKVFDSPVWRVSWSVTGNVLAVSCGDNMVTLWKQDTDSSWVQLSSIEGDNNK